MGMASICGTKAKMVSILFLRQMTTEVNINIDKQPEFIRLEMGRRKNIYRENCNEILEKMFTKKSFKALVLSIINTINLIRYF